MVQCSVGADRGHSTGAQWPVIPAAPCLGRYGVDVTFRLVGRSVVSSRRPTDIAGVVGALMGCDALSGRLVEAEATGCCRAGFERDGESTSRPRLHARGLGRDGELVPRPRPFVRGLERGGDSVGRPRPPVRGLERGGEPVGSDEAEG